LNGDGHPDIAVANRGMTSFVCLNDEPKALPYSMIAADLNGDHRPEILAWRRVGVEYGSAQKR